MSWPQIAYCQRFTAKPLSCRFVDCQTPQLPIFQLPTQELTDGPSGLVALKVEVTGGETITALALPIGANTRTAFIYTVPNKYTLN